MLIPTNHSVTVSAYYVVLLTRKMCIKWIILCALWCGISKNSESSSDKAIDTIPSSPPGKNVYKPQGKNVGIF